MQRAYSFSHDVLPVPDALFARVLKSNGQEVASLVHGLSEPTRARLALFCNSRAHLRHLGHAIADTCSDAALLREGGQAGVFLADRNTREIDKANPHMRPTRPVTLAVGNRFTAT